jgi:hypothetical protein
MAMCPFIPAPLWVSENWDPGKGLTEEIATGNCRFRERKEDKHSLQGRTGKTEN